MLRKLPSTHKLAYHLIGREMTAELLEYVGYLNAQQVKTVQVVREHGRIRADLPFRKRRDLSIPASIYTTQMRELDPGIKVESITWEDGKLVISGCAYVPSVDIRKRRHTSKIVVLRPLTRGRLPVVVRASSFRHAEAKTYSAQDRYDYDWAGFRAVISPRWFRPLGQLADRGLGRLHPGPGPRRVAGGQAALADPRIGRAASRAAGRAGHQARRPLDGQAAARAGRQDARRADRVPVPARGGFRGVVPPG